MAKTCNNCGTNEKKTPATVPYAVLEDFKETAKSNSLKWFIICLILIILLVGSNIAWLVYENSFEDVTTTEEIVVDAEDDGIANYIGNDGDIYNGEDYS
jgi:hypothetical protein